MDYMKVNGYSEVMCSVIQAMIDASLAKVKCDKTVKGIIKDDSKANFNYYTVSENNIDYIAYSNGEIYKNNESVYITIPNGDYNEQKFIVGRGYDDSSINLESLALRDFIPVGLKVQKDKYYGLVANGNKQFSSIIPLEEPLIKDLQLESDTFIDFDYFMISADFTTAIPECRSGTFGLKVELEYSDKNDITKNKTYMFLNNDMYGDIYQLKGGTQKFLLTIDKEDIKKFTKINIDLYQQSDFLDSNKQLINVSETPVNNIILNNLNIQCGYNKNNIIENDIKIDADISKTYLNDIDENGNIIFDNLGEVRWYFLIKDSNDQFLKPKTVEDLKNEGFFYKVLLYDNAFKAPENSIIEKDGWKDIQNPGFSVEDFTDSYDSDGNLIITDQDKYKNALKAWSAYIDSLNFEYQGFTINSLQGYYNKNQNKTGLQIVLCKFDENNNTKVLNRKSIFFDKREKRE